MPKSFWQYRVVQSGSRESHFELHKPSSSEVRKALSRSDATIHRSVRWFIEERQLPCLLLNEYKPDQTEDFNGTMRQCWTHHNTKREILEEVFSNWENRIIRTWYKREMTLLSKLPEYCDRVLEALGLMKTVSTGSRWTIAENKMLEITSLSHFLGPHTTSSEDRAEQTQVNVPDVQTPPSNEILHQSTTPKDKEPSKRGLRKYRRTSSAANRDARRRSTNVASSKSRSTKVSSLPEHLYIRPEEGHANNYSRRPQGGAIRSFRGSLRGREEGTLGPIRPPRKTATRRSPHKVQKAASDDDMEY